MTQTMTANTLTRLSATQTLPLIAALAIQFAGVVTLWDMRRRTRKQLKTLDWRLVDDIGLTRTQANSEANRAFWKP